jgi:hypothetical protein
MLSPVALPGTGVLDGISDPFPLTVPSGREEIYSAEWRAGKPLIHGPSLHSSTNQRSFQHLIDNRGVMKSRSDCKKNPEAPASADLSPDASSPGMASNLIRITLRGK